MSETTSEKKGINAWIGKRSEQASSPPAGQGVSLMVDIDLIDDNPKQPRREYDEVALKELMESLRLYGQMQPVTTTRQPNGRHICIAGHRRVMAHRRLRDAATEEAERARWSKVATVDRGPTATELLGELALTENLLRDDLRPMETAEAIADLKESKGLETAEEVAKALGLELTKTKRYLQLAKAPPAIRQALASGLMVEIDGETGSNGKPKREHRTLELALALIVLKAYAHWNRIKPKKAAELTRSLVDEVLRDNWTQRKLQAHVERLTGKGDEPATEQISETAPVAKPLFVSDDKRLVVNRLRLESADATEKAALKDALKAVLAALN